VTSSGTIPRGPDEWGEVLFDEQEASRTSIDQDEFIDISIVIVLIGAFAMFLTTYGAIEGYIVRSEAIVLMLLSVAFFVLGFFLILVAVMTMPLRIYEAGFTQYRVGFLDGLRRRETLVPRDKIMAVDIVEGQYDIQYILVRYDDGPLTSATINLDTFNKPTALARLEALHRIAGRKFTNKARAYLGAESWGEIL